MKDITIEKTLIFESIKGGRFNEAFQSFETIVLESNQKNHQMIAVLLQSQLSVLLDAYPSIFIKTEDWFVQFNRVVSGLIELLEDLPIDSDEAPSSCI